MINLKAVLNGHMVAAIDHVKNNNLSHKPTWFQVFKVTLYDLIWNKTIEKNGSYVVYTHIYKPHLGVKIPFVLSMYVPKENRGKGVMSEMLNSIPNKPILGSLDDDRATRYNRVGNLCVLR